MASFNNIPQKTMYQIKKTSDDGKSDRMNVTAQDLGNLDKKVSQISKMSNTSRGFNLPTLQDQETQEANKKKAHFIL